MSWLCSRLLSFLLCIFLYFPSLLLYFFICEYILLLVFFLQYSFPVFHTIISFVSPVFFFYSFIPVFSSCLIFLSFLCSFVLPILVSLLSVLSSFLSLFLYVYFLVLVCTPAFHLLPATAFCLLAAVALSPCSHAHRFTASLCCTRRPVGYFTTLYHLLRLFSAVCCSIDRTY